MTVTLNNCVSGQSTRTYPVQTGGYRTTTSAVTQGDDTACPAGSWNMDPVQTPGPPNGAVPGFNVATPGTGRGAIECHEAGGSAGCIVNTSNTGDNGWEDLRDRINDGNNDKANCVHGAPPNPIPITVRYTCANPPNGNAPSRPGRN
jgi:hypothetical protein